MWKLYLDGSSNENGSGTGIVLISPDNFKITIDKRFKFQTTNNEAKYKALITRLRLTCFMKVERIAIFSDYQLVVNQTWTNIRLEEKIFQLT